MELRILGPLEVVREGHSVPLGGPKQRTVLAHLTLRAGRFVAADLLIDEVWGEDPPPAARSSLHSYVSHLRTALGAERLEGRPGGYVLHAAPDEVDAARFETLVQEARGLALKDPTAAVSRYREAADVWRGPALDGLSDQPSLRAEIARLEELRLGAVEERITAELELGRHGELAPELDALVRAHPLRERLCAHLLIALYRSGRQADALAAYQRTRELLVEELGIDPSPELQRLQERILRQDPALEITGEPLRGYRLLEQIGAGAFGSVHRAYQPQVGREVAVKVIHPRFANDPEFIRRFEAEAHLVARLEHPHVVPLHDFWREPAGAYLVMRYLRGGSLGQRLAEGPVAPAAAARLLEQVALALAAAHRQGVVHRDVKPANILFDEEGNAYLSDFGIARDLAVESALRAGPVSPLASWMSPEQIRGEPATVRTDVYGLGLVLFEALAGRRPFAGTTPEEVMAGHPHEPLPPIRTVRPDLPAGVEEVIARATATDPDARYAEAPELAAAFRDAVAPAADRPVPVPLPAGANPYKGLRAFSEADAADFFGREALVTELVARLAEPGPGSRFLAVVGPSGSGKSSAVRAGLVPALRRGAVPGSDGWFVVDMHPGDDPFTELEAALLRISADPEARVERVERHHSGLVRAAERLLPPDAELLLVVDQLEELFTLVTDEDLRARFAAALHAVAADPRSPVRVVVTLRADFYDRPLSYRGLAELVKARTVAVTPLTAEELEGAVSGPAERAGVVVDPALVAEIVAEGAAQPAALPMLQFALTELFDHREDTALTPQAYREIGGIAGALVRRAEALYGELHAAGKQAARQLFLRLVTLGEEGSEDTRRRVLRNELTTLEVDPAAMEAAIDAFGAHRLLSFDRDPASRGPTVEVAHEALLREWGRLRDWIEAARDDLRAHRQLGAAAEEWALAGRDEAYLLLGARLVRFETWATGSGLALTADERDYLGASLARRAAERADEEARQAREAALARRTRLRRRALVSVLAVVVLGAGGLTAFTFAERARADRSARLTAAGELAAAAVANLDVDPERSILLALEAVEMTRATDGSVVRAAEEALHRAVKGSRVVYSVPQGGFGLAVTADGSRFATAGSDPADHTATVWDVETGEELLVLTGPDVGALPVVFSPDDRLAATTHNDGTVRLWDAATGEELRILRGHEGPVAFPAFSPDGRRLATGGTDETVRIWDVATGVEETTLTGVTEAPVSVAFSPDGSRLASTGWNTTAGIWDLATGEVAVTLTGHDWPVHRVAFSPDGTRVATASSDGTARIWDAASGAELLTVSTPSAISAVAFSPDGARIATGGEDAKARVWDADTGSELLTLAGHSHDVVNVAFTPDGAGLLTASLDGTTRLWDISVAGARDWLTVPGAVGIYTTVAFSPDGTWFAAPAEPSGVTVWDTQTGDEVITLTGHEPKLSTVAFSPDGRRLAAGSDLTRTPPVWDVDSGELLLTLTGHERDVRVVAFSPDGDSLATGSADGTAKVWDAATGEEQATLEPAGGAVGAVAFSPDGRFVLTGGGEVTVWDAATLEQVGTLTGHEAEVEGIAFGPDGMVVTGAGDTTAKIWDLESGDERATLRGHTGFVSGVAVSPDGTRVATASDDGTTKLWDPVTGRELLTLFGHDNLVFGVAFSPDGRLLATASPDGTVALHLLPIDELVDLARERVTRDLTDEECRRYLQRERCR